MWDRPKKRTDSAIVTGASSGLGRAIATELARAGFGVGLLARGRKDLEELVSSLNRVGGNVWALPTDMSQEEEVHRAVNEHLRRSQETSILVNNAATDVPKSLQDLTLDEWDAVSAVNLRGAFLMTHLLFPHMVSAGGGLIVNISSVGASYPWRNGAAYCASKSALETLSEVTDLEGRGQNIRSVSLAPGYMRTNWGRWTQSERREYGPVPVEADETPLEAADVARLVLFLSESWREAPLRHVLFHE